MFWVINDRKAKSNWVKPEREFTGRGKWPDTWIQTSPGPGLHLGSVLRMGFRLRLRVVTRQLLTATEQHPPGSSLVKKEDTSLPPGSSRSPVASHSSVPIANPRPWPGAGSVPTVPTPSRSTAAGPRRLRLKHLDRLPWIGTIFRRKTREG